MGYYETGTSQARDRARDQARARDRAWARDQAQDHAGGNPSLPTTSHWQFNKLVTCQLKYSARKQKIAIARLRFTSSQMFFCATKYETHLCVRPLGQHHVKQYVQQKRDLSHK